MVLPVTPSPPPAAPQTTNSIPHTPSPVISQPNHYSPPPVVSQPIYPNHPPPVQHRDPPTPIPQNFPRQAPPAVVAEPTYETQPAMSDSEMDRLERELLESLAPSAFDSPSEAPIPSQHNKPIDGQNLYFRRSDCVDRAAQIIKESNSTWSDLDSDILQAIHPQVVQVLIQISQYLTENSNTLKVERPAILISQTRLMLRQVCHIFRSHCNVEHAESG